MGSAKKRGASRLSTIGWEAIGKIGAPERSRTPNPQIRSLVLYPIELRARAAKRAGCGGANNYSRRARSGKADRENAHQPATGLASGAGRGQIMTAAAASRQW